MTEPSLPTYYAPAERASQEVVQQQAAVFRGLSLLREALDGVPDLVIILNGQRQVVYANRALLQLLNLADEKAVLGKRPGEALNCIHASETAGGCGTTEFCSTCGAVNAILVTLLGNSSVQECRITQDVDGEIQALELRVWATPLAHADEQYTIFSAIDISNEKRRRVLERIFFHDVLNTAGALQGAAYLLTNGQVPDADELEEMVFQLSNQLIDEIQAQRALLAAERDELSIHPSPVDSMCFLLELVRHYAAHAVCDGRQLRADPSAAPVAFSSDPVLLRRVVGNMVKNALEASLPGQTVTVGCRPAGDGLQFWVHNQTFIPREVQLQLFQRSFSTKGAGRGLGTYSMRLLSERYLQGAVSFVSTPDEGTTFVVTLPLQLHQEGQP